MSSRSITLRDIASALQLSTTTVSDALRGRGRVAEETIALVQHYATTHGYVGNRAAQQLRNQNANAIGLYIPPIVREFAFYMEFTFGVLTAAGNHAMDLVLITRNSDTLRSTPPNIDGIIAIDPLPDDALVTALQKLRVPFVSAGRIIDGDSPHIANNIVEVNYRTHIATLLNGIREGGAQQPVLLLPDGDFHSSFACDVLTGYQDWCTTAQRTPRVLHVPLNPSTEELTAIVQHALGVTAQNTPDVLLCGYQGLAGRILPMLIQLQHARAAHALPTQHQKRTELVSLVGDSLTELTDERITCLDVRPHAFGKAAFMALQQLQTTSGATPLHQFHEPVIRWGRTAGSLSHN